MIDRHDIHGMGHAPRHIQDFLRSFGGLNPYGESLYRLVVAECVMTQEAGEEIIEWRKDSTLAERGGMTTTLNQYGEPVQTPSTERPLRTTRGIRFVRRYVGIDGWILERWFPEIISRADWEAPGNCMTDGTPLLGPYPEFGEYKLVGGPCGEVPSVVELEGIIEQCNYNVEKQAQLKAEHASHRHMRMRARYAQELIAELKKKQAIAARISDDSKFLRSSSLEAGRIREQLAQQIRARGGQIGHVGN